MKASQAAILAGTAGLAIGATVGFFIGVLSTEGGRKFFQLLTAVEAQPDLANPKAISRERFSLQYPGNWKVKIDSKHYDPDHDFVIESPGGGASVVFIVMDMATDPDAHVKAQVKGLTRKLLKVEKQSPLSRWGHYEGKGVRLEGRMMAFAPSEQDVFSHSENGISFVVVENMSRAQLGTYYDDAFHLISESFVLSAPRAGE